MTWLEELSTCWDRAETAVRNEIWKKHWGADEEFVTALFRGELRFALENANADDQFANALCDEVRALGFTEIDESIVRREARGLAASVVFHPKLTEGVTGADFGLLISVPRLQRDSDLHVTATCLRHQGLLVQAKMKRYREPPGKFTDSQKSALPRHSEFSAVLLYQYQDATLKQLAPFGWHTCRGRTMEDLRRALCSATSASTLTSKDILSRLWSGAVGTDDSQELHSLVAPTVPPALEVRIAWPEDAPRAFLIRQSVMTQVR